MWKDVILFSEHIANHCSMMLFLLQPLLCYLPVDGRVDLWAPTALAFQSNSRMHHYMCVVPCKDISLQRGWFCVGSHSLLYPKIQQRQVIMNVLHPGCALPPWWSPPVLWRRFEDGLVSICILIHSCSCWNTELCPALWMCINPNSFCHYLQTHYFQQAFQHFCAFFFAPHIQLLLAFTYF